MQFSINQTWPEETLVREDINLNTSEGESMRGEDCSYSQEQRIDLYDWLVEVEGVGEQDIKNAYNVYCYGEEPSLSL